MRQFNVIDKFIIECDKAIRTVWGQPIVSDRTSPANEIQEPELTEQEKRHAMRLMRVNHAGEVSAQALYQGQALTAKLPQVRQAMDQAAIEENDHLVWCEQRITELGGRTSLLNPFWYVGSLTLGAVAGKISDKWSLGFVAETETQVVKHLEGHLAELSDKDSKSRAIIQQMCDDEQHHKEVAVAAGGRVLPEAIKSTMTYMSQVMIATSYRL